jgi:hypothetical protein
MIARRPYLPRHMAEGAPAIPSMHARCISTAPCIGIHGDNAPETICTQVSSGLLSLTANTDARSVQGYSHWRSLDFL